MSNFHHLLGMVTYRAGVDDCTEHCEGDGHWHGIEESDKEES